MLLVPVRRGLRWSNELERLASSHDAMAPAEVKAALAVALGPKAESYWRTFSDFLQAKISRAEFEDLMVDKLTTPQLSGPVLSLYAK